MEYFLPNRNNICQFDYNNIVTSENSINCDGINNNDIISNDNININNNNNNDGNGNDNVLIILILISLIVLILLVFVMLTILLIMVIVLIMEDDWWGYDLINLLLIQFYQWNYHE
mgnify:CR=1 FL=1